MSDARDDTLNIILNTKLELHLLIPTVYTTLAAPFYTEITSKTFILQTPYTNLDKFCQAVKLFELELINAYFEYYGRYSYIQSILSLMQDQNISHSIESDR